MTKGKKNFIKKNDLGMWILHRGIIAGEKLWMLSNLKQYESAPTL